MAGETTVGREPIQIVEIKQPICTNTFSIAPCTATGTADTKCYNTRATCQDTPNFALDPTPLSLFFGKKQAAKPSDNIYIIPSLISVSMAPTQINLAVTSKDQGGLGARAVASVVLQDHPHNDRIVDPYQSGRTFDPFARGSFWSKWNVRNKYRTGMTIIVYSGYAGQALSVMTSRQYQLERITGPNGGKVTITAKDILAKLEERKAQAPEASPGKVFADIDDAVTSIEVSEAVEADYSASGTIRIGSEVMAYSARALNGNGRLDFTITTRGTDGTTSAAHSADDAVQECLRFTSVRVDSVLNTLLTTYAGIPASFIPTADWTAEADDYLSFFNLTTLITVPTSVTKLVSELSEQCALYIFWNEVDKEIQLKAIRGITAAPATLTEASNIVAGSVNITEKPEERVSQVWTFYGQKDPTKPLTDEANYLASNILADLTQETDELYGEKSVRKIFSRWLPTDALVNTLNSKILTRYIDPPRQITFILDAKDRTLWVGDTRYLDHFLDVDEFGVKRNRLWTIISADESKPGDQVQYMAEDTTLYGKIQVIMANGTGDYVGDGTDAFNGAWITDDAGLYSNGDTGATIA